MTTPISGFTPTTPASGSASTSLNGMTGGDFLQLMIQQLQQQDPLNPTDSNQLLSQMSQISTLQSNTQMEQSLEGLTLQQSIGAGANLMGKYVQGLDANGGPIQGTVTSVQVKNKNIFLELDSSQELPMGNVTNIGATANTSATPGVTTNGSSNTSSSIITNLANQLAAAIAGKAA